MKQPILIGMRQLSNRCVEERDACEPADLEVEASA